MSDIINIDQFETVENIEISVFPTYTEININRISGSSGSGAVSSVNGQIGDVVLTKTNLGLGNVDNTSDANKPISTATQTALDLKVDKITGKGLSANDYTTAEKTKLSGIQDGAEVNVNADWNATTGDAVILNKPTIPTAVTQTSQLTNNGADGINPFISALDIPTAGQASTLVREVKNMTGATLTKGTVVYISGANGNKALVSKALAVSDALSSRTFGLLQSDILNNGLGNCVIIGDLIGLDTSAFSEGAQLYLSGTTAGTYTETKILAPTHLVYIGKVTRSHPTLGQIEVGIQNGYELAEIHDCQIISPANNQSLIYETSTGLWKNKNLIDILENFNRTQGIYFFEEFMGNQGGSVLTSFSGVISAVAGVGASCISTSTTFPIINRTNQQGVVRAQTGTTNSGSAGFTYGAINLFRGTGAISIETYVTIETLSTATERFHTFFGYLGTANLNNPPNGIFFAYDEGGAIGFVGNGSPNWKCVAINTSTRTFFTTSLPVVAGTWYKLRIDLNASGTQASFYIDGNFITTLNTNIPLATTPMNINNLIVKTIGTNTRAIQNDYFMYEEIFTNPR